MNVISPLLRHALWLGLAAVTLSGVTLAEGTGLLDKTSASDVASAREFYELKSRKLELDRVPAEVSRTVEEALPGIKVSEAFLVQHRPITYVPVKTEYRLKGRDSEGREVSVRTDEDGSHPTATWVIPLEKVPAKVLAEGKPYATKHGYEFSRALLVTRYERSLVRTTVHSTYFLKGTTPSKPGAEAFVWLSSAGRFRLRDLDDLLWKTVLSE
jgi:hypothetical protein